MSTKLGRWATCTFALVCLLWASQAQAQRYGVNQTITKTKTISVCRTLGLNCNDECDTVLSAHCKAVGKNFCSTGDIFISASSGGTASSNCSGVTPISGSPLCFSFQKLHLGPITCSGPCNALCERAFTPECSNANDCFNMYGDPGLGTWECWFGECTLTNSPLVLHLPDYLDSGNASPSWWKKGFCDDQSPTVCLDWKGDGNTSCTSWFEPGSANAFVVSLSDDDLFDLASVGSVEAQPWRHFFGNVTQGPGGDFPYEHGFEALAAHCGQELTGSGFETASCGNDLYAWSDQDGDGSIELAELVDFADLGIESFGKVRQTGKKDKCGNTFKVESHAYCAGGKCGTVLDVFFQRQ